LTGNLPVFLIRLVSSVIDAVTAMIEIFFRFTMPFQSQKFASNLPAKTRLSARKWRSNEVSDKFATI